MLKLNKDALVTLVDMPKYKSAVGAAAETVKCASRTVEDGGRESFWSGCEPKSVPTAQVNPIRTTRSLQARHIANSTVWGSFVDMVAGVST